MYRKGIQRIFFERSYQTVVFKQPRTTTKKVENTAAQAGSVENERFLELSRIQFCFGFFLQDRPSSLRNNRIHLLQTKSQSAKNKFDAYASNRKQIFFHMRQDWSFFFKKKKKKGGGQSPMNPIPMVKHRHESTILSFNLIHDLESHWKRP